jgi:DNA-binding XRE family transcriptional regulator
MKKSSKTKSKAARAIELGKMSMNKKEKVTELASQTSWATIWQ